MRIHLHSQAFAAIMLCSASALAAPNLELSGLYTDHMVIQREQPVKISGTTKPGDTVKVSLNGASAQATADDNGKWTAQLPEQSAGGPFEITVSDADETTSIKDVLIGDIWVCGGQSNMAFGLQRGVHGKEAIKSAANPNLRLYMVARDKALKPLSDLTKPGQWEVSSPETVPNFSAVGYYFGKKLQSELNVPIGLIHSNWGGTRVEWWTPAEGLKGNADAADELKTVEAGTTEQQLRAQYEKNEKPWLTNFRSADPGSKQQENWSAPDFDDASWETVKLPMKKTQGYLGENDGSAWFRKTITLSADAAAKPTTLELACIDDVVTAYVNGKKIGDSKKALKPQSFNIPANLLKEGENTITIQVIDLGKSGGLCGDISLAPASSEVTSLSGPWKFHAGLTLKDGPERPKAPHAIRPTVLYNAMIAPLQKLPIRGAIWYQGEANTKSDLAGHYGKSFASMITQWRKGWGQGDFPFLFVQLASYMKIEPEPIESDWAVLREQQEKTMSLVDHTAMATAIDVGEQDDIHPRDKLTVGNRLALGALAIEYGKDIEYMGPIYESSTINDGKVTLSFSHAEKLKTKNGDPLKGFAVAGADGKFVWADAKIDGNKVVVSSPKINEPKAVRYGWTNYSTGNLYNGADLPASPFRTDRPAK